MAKPRQDLAEEYKVVAPLADSFCAELQRQLGLWLEQQGFRPVTRIERLVQSWPALAEEIDRSNLKPNSCKEIPGLVRLRILVLSRVEARILRELLAHHFTVTAAEEPKVDSQAAFADQVAEFALDLPEAWKAIPSLSLGRELQVRVQVRTLSHHLYAEACLASGNNAGSRAALRFGVLLEAAELELERILTPPEPSSNGSSSPRGNGAITDTPTELVRAQDADVVIEPPNFQKARTEASGAQEQSAMRLFDAINGTRDKARRVQFIAEMKAIYQAGEDNPVVRRLLAKAFQTLLSESSPEADQLRREQWLTELRSLYHANSEDVTVRGLMARGLSQVLSETGNATERNQLLAELRAIQSAFPDDPALRKLMAKF